MNTMTLLDMAADSFGTRIAVSSNANTLTYEELRSHAGRGAAYLKRHGIDRLVYTGTNDVAFVIAIFAASWASIPLVPLNYRLGEEQLLEVMKDQSGSVASIVGDRTPDAVRSVGGEILRIEDWLAISADDATDVAGNWSNDPEDIAVILYTSGTTSKPKAALLRHRHLTSYVLASIEFGAADDEAAALVAVPPYHIAGISNVLSNVFSGRRIVQLQQFDPLEWLEIARREAVSHALVVPTMLARIVEAVGDRPDAGLPSLRTLAYGGAPMPRKVIERALEVFPVTGFVNAYGLTETSSTIAVLGPDDHRRAIEDGDEAAWTRLSSAGQIVPGIEVEVRDDRGEPLPANAVGEIYVRGSQVSGEYAEQGSTLDDAGWFATRDRGYFDSESYLFVEGRADDTIIRGGENVAPAEIEDVLLRYPGVRDAAVVGVPDEEWGQRIAAVVTVKPGGRLRVGDLDEFCRQHLRSSKTPDSIEVWDELPRTDTGKLLRRTIESLLT